jgi:hypothetical protein
MGKIKNLLRDWLQISEEKFHLEAELIRIRGRINGLESQLDNAEYHIEELKRVSGNLEYLIEEKVSVDDIEEHIEDNISYDTIKDNVFDLVMEEIENRDTLKELVKSEIDEISLDIDTHRNTVDIEEITEDIVERLVARLRG